MLGVKAGSCWEQTKPALKKEVPPVEMREVKLTRLIEQGVEGALGKTEKGEGEGEEMKMTLEVVVAVVALRKTGQEEEGM